MNLSLAFDKFLGRGRDKRIERPYGIAFWLGDQPSFAASLSLALQHLAIQSIYFVIPAASAAAVSNDPAQITRFLCLSILASAIWQALQLFTRGPIGSGYPIPGTHTAALISACVLAGHAGAGFGGIGAMAFITGIVAMLLTFALGRLRIVLPNEIAGVVVMLIGVSLIGLAAVQLGLQPGGTPRGLHAVIVVVGAIILMAVIALSKTKAARLAVLIGAVLSILPALWLGEGTQNAGAILAAQPWFALPVPWVPDFGAITAAPMAAFLLSLVALKATATGSFLVMQRVSDASWTRPDAPPLRRGLLANGLGIAIAGLIGGAVPGPATAAVGLSAATGTLARRVVWFGVPLLVVLAFCPKLVGLFVLMPAPVKAAM
ncbi:MAG TPA: solute carrier family 23 protein, partial [Acidocella sp.]|nr:solute carrier family 23 protein [Acidocella sp.]